jgi:hypothetical protein
MIIYSNSCSFGVISDGRVYSDFVSEYFNATLINNGKVGSCNARIIRTTTRDILDLKQTTDEEIVALIGLSNTSRHEFWDDLLTPDNHDGHFVSFTSSNQVATNYKNFTKEWFLSYNHEAETTNLLHQAILLDSFLNLNNIKHLICSSTPIDGIDPNMPFLKNFYNASLTSNSIMPLLDFNFCEYCVSQGHAPIDYNSVDPRIGHQGDHGHRDFANFLINKIQ